MAFKITQRIDGLEPVLKRLFWLRKNIAKKIARKAMGAGAKVLVQQTRISRGISDWTHGELLVGALQILKKSLGKKVIVNRRGQVIGIVGAREGLKTQIGVVSRGPNKGQPIFYDPANIIHLVELGHAGPAPAPSHPFMKPALSASTGRVMDVIATEIDKGVSEAIQ